MAKMSEAAAPTPLVPDPYARVLLLTKPGCHLCDQARDIIEAVCAESGEAYADVDISTDDQLLAAYREQVPVTFVDGRRHAYWTVDPSRLRDALRDPPSPA